MTHLLNGAFYQFLIQFCIILFPHDPATFDWIPFPARIQLALLLDRANAVVIRHEKQKLLGAKAEAISSDEQECFNLCGQRLKQEYQDAEQRRKSDAEHGKLTPPEPDLEYWQQVCEKKMYEARKAEGEPVQFVDGHLCIDASLYNDALWICPGPYPGLQYYTFYTRFKPDLDLLRSFGEEGGKRPENYGQRLVHMEENGDFALHSPTRRWYMQRYGIIGPATFAEMMKDVEYDSMPMSLYSLGRH